MASPPLYLTPVPKADIERGRGPLVSQFIQGTEENNFADGYCRITKESIGGHAGQLIRLRPWQTNITGMVYAVRPDGRYRHREALIGLPRKNGKSAIGSSYALDGLVMGPYGSEIYSCASDKDQAKIVFGVAKKMVELDPELSGIIKCYRDALEYTDNGSVYKAVSSDAFTKEGLNPTVVVYDELHAAPNDELYHVMAEAFGARPNPLLIIITTAGVKKDSTGQDSICYRRYQFGVQVAKGEVVDPTFFMAWWGAPEGADYKDPKVWQAANPGYGDIIDPEDFPSVLNKVTENDFRTKRLNQWVSSVQAWLPQGAWAACRNAERPFTPGPRGVVLGFDGSLTNDCSALVAVTVESDPQVKVLGLWERPLDLPKGEEFRVPRGEVKDAIRQACTDYVVREIAWDQWLWLDAAEELADEGLPVVQFPQTLTRMGPATQRFYELVINRKIEHDGNPALARHLSNAQLKTDTRGSRLQKDAKMSPRKIDLAVASVMAVDRAGFWMTEDLPNTFNGVPVKDIRFVW